MRKPLLLIFILIVCSILSRPVLGQHFIGENRIFLNKPENIKKAKVESLSILKYTFKDGEVVDTSVIQVNYYDTLGNVVLMRYAHGQSFYNYNNGMLTNIVHSYSAPHLRTTSNFMYDSTGKLVEQTTVSTNSELNGDYKFEYDKGNLIKVYKKNTDEKFVLIEIYEYEGHSLVAIKKIKKNKVEFVSIFEHEPGIITKYFKQKKKKTKTSESFYNSGKLIKSITYPYLPPVMPGTFVLYSAPRSVNNYSYNSDNPVIELITLEREEIISKQRYIYTYRN